MKKVKLPKDIADCIEKVRKDNDTNYEILVQVKGAIVTDYLLKLKKYFFEGNKSSPDILLEALVNDYEVEESPKEKIFKIHKYHTNAESTTVSADSYHAGVSEGIIETLNILGIKIEGVNKFEEEN